MDQARRVCTEATADGPERGGCPGNRPARLRRRVPLRSMAACSMVVLAMVVAGCSSKTSTSNASSSTTAASSTTSYPAGKEQVCQARDQLKASVDALAKPSTLTGGASSIKAAADTVQNNLTDLKTAAKQDYEAPVAAVQTSLQDLQTAAGNLGNGNAAQNLQAVSTAITSVGTASSDLFTQLKASCGS